MDVTLNQARALILKEANSDRPSELDPFTNRHIQQAVHKLRNRGALDAVPALRGAFKMCGYNVHGPNYRVKKT